MLYSGQPEIMFSLQQFSALILLLGVGNGAFANYYYDNRGVYTVAPQHVVQPTSLPYLNPPSPASYPNNNNVDFTRAPSSSYPADSYPDSSGDEDYPIDDDAHRDSPVPGQGGDDAKSGSAPALPYLRDTLALSAISVISVMGLNL